MRILFIGYWGFADPLTVATIMPNLELLHQLDHVEHITLATIEREPTADDSSWEATFPAPRLSLRPLYSREGASLLLTKADDFWRFPRELAAIMEAEQLDTIIGHGAPGAALAYLVSRRTGHPFYATMYEPHANYMLDAKIWRRFDPRYLVQRLLETQVKRWAAGIIPAADAYNEQLTQEGVPAERLRTGPCMVSLRTFGFNAEARRQTRQRLGFGATAPVGVYLGKFGGLYYDEEAFDVFKEAADQFGPDFCLIILTPGGVEEAQARLLAIGIPAARSYVAKVAHHEVPAFLSAADFAFATVKFAPSNRYRSLVKVAEYWASGLPVLLTEGVGDESAILAHEEGGATFNLARPASIGHALRRIQAQLLVPGYRGRIRQLAEHYRSPARNLLAFEQLLFPSVAAIA
ncbi:glycosyltransferase [Hymenobacter bucti]|uniref:Glycosyltransferase n=1 Tax=Hymenobacter bucti TaxID=1844114 RepID=A0ABW4QW38_9BACT